MTSPLQRLALPACALLLALASGGAGASQITGTGIGATNHPTIAGANTTTTKPAKGAKNGAPAASGAHK